MRTKLLNFCMILVALLVGAGIMFGFINYKLEPKTVEKILENRNVTITDTGIAEAVDKMYDSVVLVNVSSNRSSGFGSGWIYKIDGDTTYIITNHHVINGATKITVEALKEDKEYEATLVGSDAFDDIAVIKIKTVDKFKESNIGDLSKLSLGDTVFTIGTPIEKTYKGTVTRGIISGVERLVPVAIESNYVYDYLMRAIQTDATINSGNSGGPLCNVNGEVIGINTMKLASTTTENMSFAISIDEVIPLIDEIIKNGKVERPYVGISTTDLNSARYQFGNNVNISEDAEGIFVVDVEKNSPADKAGFKSNDIITKIEDTKITSLAEFKYYLFKNKPKNKIKITVLRNGKETVLEVELANR